MFLELASHEDVYYTKYNKEQNISHSQVNYGSREKVFNL